MQRTVVIRHEVYVEININDAIGLEPYSDYTLREHLEDQAREEGRTVVAQHGMVYVFSDGEVELLEERRERIPLAVLDQETRALLEAHSIPPMLQWVSGACFGSVC